MTIFIENGLFYIYDERGYRFPNSFKSREEAIHFINNYSH